MLEQSSEVEITIHISPPSVDGMNFSLSKRRCKSQNELLNMVQQLPFGTSPRSFQAALKESSVQNWKVKYLQEIAFRKTTGKEMLSER